MENIKKVLIVEDDEHIAKVYQVRFAREGYQTVWVTNGEDALAKIPVLVLSNLGQPSDKDRALGLGASEYLVKIDNSMQEVIEHSKKYLN